MTTDLGDLIAPAGVLHEPPLTDKRALLTAMAARAAALSAQDAGQVLDVILGREALGSTGFGAGTAIPHGRLDSLGHVVAVIAKLAAPIDFAALDGEPVDLVVLMLAPSGAGAEHLKALARVSRALRDAAFVARLRGSASAEALYAELAGDARSRAA